MADAPLTIKATFNNFPFGFISFIKASVGKGDTQVIRNPVILTLSSPILLPIQVKGLWSSFCSSMVIGRLPKRNTEIEHTTPIASNTGVISNFSEIWRVCAIAPNINPPRRITRKTFTYAPKIFMVSAENFANPIPQMAAIDIGKTVSHKILPMDKPDKIPPIIRAKGRPRRPRTIPFAK